MKRILLILDIFFLLVFLSLGTYLFFFKSATAVPQQLFLTPPGCPLVVHAQDKPSPLEEVAPYKFADLPHGRIYKAMHEGCELFIVENDFHTDYHNRSEHSYSITTGRGCK